MAINFPANPSINDTFIVSGIIFTWTGVKWKSTAVTEISSDTSPELGGELDLNNTGITGTGNINVTGVITATSLSGDVTTNSLVVSGVSTFNNDIRLLDDDNLYFGTDNDTSIVHSGSNTIMNVNGNYFFQGNTFYVQNQAGSKNYIRAYPSTTGAVELFHDNNKKLETTSSGVTVSGACTATSFSGDGSNLVSGRWTLGANGTSDYTFTGIGFTQTTNDPTLYLKRGEVYEFVNNSGGSHPFQIRETNGGAAYNNGVTNNGAASGTITFAVPYNAPDTLYYQCMNHSNMGGDITILGGGGGGGGISAANWINAL